MDCSTDNFQTFRKKQDHSQPKDQLRSIVSQLEHQLLMSQQRQEAIRRANQKLTAVIVMNNQRHQQHLSRIEMLGQGGVGEEVRRSVEKGFKAQGIIKSKTKVGYNSSYQGKKQVRVKTEQSDENNFLMANTSSVCLNRKQVKDKLKRQH